MLGTCDVMAFLATSDPPRARSFYEDILGLRLIADEPWAIVFDANGTRLRIQKSQKFTPHPFTALGWEVQNIRDSIRDLTKNGVAFEKFNIPGLSRTSGGSGPRRTARWSRGSRTRMGTSCRSRSSEWPRPVVQPDRIAECESADCGSSPRRGMGA